MNTSITVSDILVENVGKIIADSVASGVNELILFSIFAADYNEKHQKLLKKRPEMAKGKADARAEVMEMTVKGRHGENGYYPQARYNAVGASSKQMIW